MGDNDRAGIVVVAGDETVVMVAPARELEEIMVLLRADRRVEK